MVRAALTALAGELVELDVAGHRGWTTAAGAAAVATAEPDHTVRLLPGFDPYVVGVLRQLEHLVPAGHRAAVSRASGWISPVLLHGGRIVGTWAQEQAGGRLRITVTPPTRLPPAVRSAAAAEAERWAGYADTPLDLVWS